MIVKVLYFAVARDLASKAKESLTVPDGSSVSTLGSELLKLHPALGKLKDSIRFSVNFDVVNGSAQLHDGDEVGVLPPVAGG